MAQEIRVFAKCPDCDKGISFTVSPKDLDCASDGFDEAEWEQDYDDKDRPYVCPECMGKRLAQQKEDEWEADREADAMQRDQELDYAEYAAGLVRSVARGW